MAGQKKQHTNKVKWRKESVLAKKKWPWWKTAGVQIQSHRSLLLHWSISWSGRLLDTKVDPLSVKWERNKEERKQRNWERQARQTDNRECKNYIYRTVFCLFRITSGKNQAPHLNPLARQTDPLNVEYIVRAMHFHMSVQMPRGNNTRDWLPVGDQWLVITQWLITSENSNGRCKDAQQWSEK